MKITKKKRVGLLNEKPLSKEFRMWIEDDEKLKKLLEEGSGGCISVNPWDKKVAYAGWKTGRYPIISLINKSGTILDYGCANGFLLRSLQEWSNHELKPYGFDIDEQAIAKARKLFPHQQNHFACPEDNWESLGWPENFDFVYWQVWHNYSFTTQENLTLLRRLQSLTKKGGRLILGFYDVRRENLKKIEQLRRFGFKPSGVLRNPNGKHVWIWFEVNPSTG